MRRGWGSGEWRWFMLIPARGHHTYRLHPRHVRLDWRAYALCDELWVRTATLMSALSTGDHETPLSVCNFVRTVKTRMSSPGQLTAVFDGIPPHVLFKLSKKQEETTRSLEKIEKGESGRVCLFQCAMRFVCA